jgi:mRNA interferase RelE/StbE
MHDIDIAPAAAKFLKNLVISRRAFADRIVHAIDGLRQDPLRGKKLTGDLSAYRSLQVGEYRILYTIVHKRILIQIVKIGHRREIYR